MKIIILLVMLFSVLAVPDSPVTAEVEGKKEFAAGCNPNVCYPAGYEVYTDKGVLPVEDKTVFDWVEPGDRVSIENGKVTKVWKS